MSANKKVLGKSKSSLISNLTASFPWLKNKTFLIPALASVLAISVVGSVLAVQITNSPSAEESGDVSKDESIAEVIAEPVIGPACVEGEEVCEHVKYLLLEADYVDGVNPWGYEELIESIVYQFNVTSEFARAVVDAVEYDWGDEVTASESLESGSTPAPSTVIPKSPQDLPAPTAVIPPQTGLSPTEAARMFVDQMESSFFAYSRTKSIDYLVSGYKIERSAATTALDALNVNWNLAASKAARWFATQSWTSYRSKIGWQEILVNEERFTASEADFAIDSLNLDWNAQASRAAKWILEGNSCDAFVQQTASGPSALIDDLASYVVGTFKFTEDEAYFGAMDQLELEGEWVWKSFPNCST